MTEALNEPNGAQLTFAIFHVSHLGHILVSKYLSLIFSVLFLTFKNPPYDVVILKPDGNYTYTGSGLLWQSWLAEKLNFTYVFYSSYFNYNYSTTSTLFELTVSRTALWCSTK